MSLYDYLTKYYAEPFSQEDFKSHFLEKFGVDVRFEKDLVLFKYSMICAKFQFPLVRECRGHIWRHSNGVWTRVCNPPDKFWNLGEGNNPLFDSKDFEENASQLQAISKEDGSLINVWWDSTLNDWRASTSGTITPFFVGDYKVTFDQLFWSLFGVDKKEVLTSIGKDYTFCFELCSVENQIVTKYVTNRVYLLLIRHNIYGTYLVPSEYAETLKVRLPKSFFLYEKDIKTKEEIVKWVEENTPDDSDAMYKEGWVLYRAGIPLAKIKKIDYLSRHKFSGGDIGATRNNIIEVFFSNCLDDYYDGLVVSMKEFADKLREKVIVMNQKVNVSIHELKGKSFANQKEYALWVLANVDKQFSAFFFANKDSLMKGEIDNDAFVHWLKLSYKKFDLYWKE